MHFFLLRGEWLCLNSTKWYNLFLFRWKILIYRRMFIEERIVMIHFYICMGYFLNTFLGRNLYRKQMYRIMFLRDFFQSVFTLRNFNNVWMLSYHISIFYPSYVLYEITSNVFLCMWWRGLASKKQNVSVGRGRFQHF